LRLETQPKDGKGVPLPVKGVHWSLTHKCDAVGAIAAPLPVGIDLEILRPVNPALFAKVADDKEWGLIGKRRLNHFFRLWTAKEAILKAVGRGISGLSHCKVVRVDDPTHMQLVYHGTQWTVEHFWFEGHVAALTAYDFYIRWNEVS
jgi:4'-phosphopantetheinyl transferase